MPANPTKQRYCNMLQQILRGSSCNARSQSQHLSAAPISSSTLRRTPPIQSCILQVIPRRTLIAAPRAGDGPLLERRPDRALPDIHPRRTYIYSLPFFLAAIGVSTLVIFNYQKQNSSVVASTLYALRTHSKARELLGDDIQFKSRMPWISGEMDQLHGIIDISYAVKGNKSDGTMYFRSTRRSRMGLFETEEWELVMGDGRRLRLLDDPKAADPFPQELPSSVGSDVEI